MFITTILDCKSFNYVHFYQHLILLLLISKDFHTFLLYDLTKKTAFQNFFDVLKSCNFSFTCTLSS
nr:MAG TPA: hypothetical protein [Caudoviricetes sp.]